MIRKRIVTLFSFVMLASLVLGLGACSLVSSSEGGGDGQPTPTPIPTSIVPTNPTYVVQRGEVIRLLQFSGRVAPVLEEQLFFRTNGYVDKVYVGRNDEVKAGDLLAELEVVDLKNQITQKEAELQAVVMDFDRRMTEAESSVRSAELRLAKLHASSSDSQIISARINLERAEKSLSDAIDNYNKSLDRDWEKDAVREGYANAVQNAQWNLEVAQAQYTDALKSSERLNYDIELSEMDLDLAKMRMAEIEVGLDVTRTQLSLQRLEDQLNDARIIAPFDGVILSISLVQGKQIQGYNEVMILADPSNLEISADLQDSELSELSEGMPLIAEFINRPGEQLTGIIRRLPYPYSGGGLTAGVDDEDPSVRITLDDMDPEKYNYDIGDRLRITIELERVDDTLWLPPQAVRTFEGRSFVVAQEGGAQRRIDVRLGIRSSDRLEILDGLTEGQIVIAP
jgi:RND family efflux transporter MFP subunit